ncbi:bifunctional diaminohydroxyphosphoribosylaminopyrimidine deaminase/5-amino-6-(5-phosphoribosylamino)uracil reductase RibD [Aliivibrio kagoshimensis]|uniref:bifunctional diaminohydroxyphosphoribosylaminopyrimidine deaminase/5-amino-6-(5-phosphoribosylamino)uracil reductase RibD n=1 Tax=Aliivibrio kagoshimensis TaxID=2910230 RepID=UPI003D0D9176
MFSATDHSMMQQAIHLATKGVYTTAPNPNVGCVISLHGEIVGQGFHAKAGEPHAEVHALKEAGSQAKGATVYVTLEPCSHYGRTPPCAEALIKAGVAKVICAMVDPNPSVSGRGIAMLKEAGIEVHHGLLEQDARALNPGFIKRMESGKPFVRLKMAASLDGRTALKNGESKWITGPKARQDVQVFRAKSSAILSTSSTVITDNASLNVRHAELPNYVQDMLPIQQLRQPLRVILDRQQHLTPDLNLFKTAYEPLIVHCGLESEQREHVLCMNTVSGGFDLDELLTTLAMHYQVNELWVEAGATLAASFVEQNAVDELILYLAPKFMGADSRGLLNMIGLEKMSEVLELHISDVRMVGQDIRITATPIQAKQ